MNAKDAKNPPRPAITSLTEIQLQNLLEKLRAEQVLAGRPDAQN